MKNILLILSFIIIPLSAMEKSQPEPFPYGDLLPELQQEILKFKQVAQSKNITEAIQNLKVLMQINKKFNSQAFISSYLDALSKKFPDQEIRIANLLRNPLGDKWLNTKRKNQPYTRKLTDERAIMAGQLALVNGETNKDGYKKLRDWLDKGYNPNVLLDYIVGLGLESADALALLISYGADVNYTWFPGFRSLDGLLNKKISLLERLREKREHVLQDEFANRPEFPKLVAGYDDMINYLLQEGALDTNLSK